MLISQDNEKRLTFQIRFYFVANTSTSILPPIQEKATDKLDYNRMLERNNEIGIIMKQ